MTKTPHKLASILKNIQNLEPQSNKSFRDQVIGVLKQGVIKYEIIETHNTPSIVLIVEIDNTKTVIKAEYGFNTSVEKEIKWYMSAPKLSCIPKFLGWFVGPSFSYLVIEHVSKASTLDNLVLNNQIDINYLLKLVDEALQKDEVLFKFGAKIKVNLEEADAPFYGRFKSRLLEVKDKDLLDVLKQPKIVINNTSYRSASYYINKIHRIPHIRQYLLSRNFGAIHGDLHFGNILVSDRKLRLIDPNGRNLPLAYDYGKILHSTHSHYGAIMSGDYILSNPQRHEYQLSIKKSEQLELAHTHLHSTIGDKNYLQGLYAEAFHFAAATAHHQRNTREAVTLYLLSVQLFDELLYNLNIK